MTGIASTIGAVVIGRNEGERLPRALQSVRAAGLPLIYVDSGSADDSVAIGTRLADRVVELDPARPFSAARARNEGLDALIAMGGAAGLPAYVLFLDGDCALAPGFAAVAAATLDADPVIAIVTGHLSEQDAAATVFGRLSALEWHSGVGEITDFGNLGGIMLARVAAVRSVGGFNPLMVAGEDSELGVRLALAGHRIVKIDAAMAEHRADITRFDQWWKRSVRAGQAMAHRFALHGRSRLADCRRELVSTILWGIALPLLIVIALVPSRGFSLLLLLAGYALLWWRMRGHFKRAGASPADARAGASYGLAAKFANALGIIRFALDRIRGRVRILEYK